MIVLGNGVVACVTLEKSYGQNGGWMVVTAGWCFAVLAGVFTALALGSNGQLNPAVTIGVAVATGQWGNVSTYILAQLLGAMAGATLVWLHYLPHWGITDNPAGKRSCFCTAPAVRKFVPNVLSEVVGTFVLVFVAAALASSHSMPTGVAPGLAPVLVGFLVWSIGLSLGGVTGYAINPARDLGPRIVYTFLPLPGKGSSGWDYALVPVVGPIIGASLAGWIVRLAAI